MCLWKAYLVTKLNINQYVAVCCLYPTQCGYLYIFCKNVNLFDYGVLTQMLPGVMTQNAKQLHHTAFLTSEKLWVENILNLGVWDKNLSNNESSNQVARRAAEIRREIRKPGVWINGTFFTLANFRFRMVSLHRTKDVLRHRSYRLSRVSSIHKGGPNTGAHLIPFQVPGEHSTGNYVLLQYYLLALQSQPFQLAGTAS